MSFLHAYQHLERIGKIRHARFSCTHDLVPVVPFWWVVICSFAFCCTQIRYCFYAHILHFFTATLTGSNHVKFDLWDTAGVDKNGTLRDGYYVGANGALLKCMMWHQNVSMCNIVWFFTYSYLMFDQSTKLFVSFSPGLKQKIWLTCTKTSLVYVVMTFHYVVVCGNQAWNVSLLAPQVYNFVSPRVGMRAC